MRTLVRLLLFLPALIWGCAQAQQHTVFCSGADSAGKPVRVYLSTSGGVLNIYDEQHSLARQPGGSYRSETYRTNQGTTVYNVILSFANNTQTMLQQINSITNTVITTVNLDCR